MSKNQEKETKNIENELTFASATDIIEEKDISRKLENPKHFFRNRLKSLSEKDYEGKGTCYYYLLRITLQKGIMIESANEKNLYHKMNECFKIREKELIQNYKKKKNFVAKLQLRAFYKLMEAYYSTIEYYYDQHDIIDAVEAAYETKMDFRKDRFFLERKIFKWFEYFLLKITCMYGNSFGRWGITGIIVMTGFAVLFIATDPELLMTAPKGSHFYDYFYYSVVTFTTLGYGDITPIYGIQKLLTVIEVFFGYVQLGLFLTLIQKKL